MGTCKGCTYFNACGQENRTAPCKGYQSKEDRKRTEKAQENAKIQDRVITKREETFLII